MATLITPALDDEPWPTLGPQVCDFIEERAIFGPGDLKGQPARLSIEKRAIIYRAYEVFPQGHRYAGRRRFKRVGWSVRKGLAKTEVLAWVAYTELHPEAPVRGDGFDASGNPVGRPVASPYIPLLAYNKDQTEELAYGCLFVVVTEGPDADIFDAGLDRILRLDGRGRPDGKAVPLANSPNARDGARTTFQGFDEPHRMFLPRLRDAHETMGNNLPKRPLADAWSFYVGTAGQLGQGSIAEDLYKEAELVRDGRIKDSRFFFFHRDAGAAHRGTDPNARGHDLSTEAGRIAAIAEATGPEGEYGVGQFEGIAEIYTRPKTDRAYWERVWLNLWRQADRQGFDPTRLSELIVPGKITPMSWVTAGFDGARFRDATGIVLTEIATGIQQTWALWERPDDAPEWEVDPAEVDAAVDQLMSTFQVWRWNGDPPHWLESHANWAGRYPCVEEWFTHRISAMAFATRDYQQAVQDGSVKFADDPRPALNSPVENETMAAALLRHLANVGKREVNLYDDDGRRLWTPEKQREDQKIDLSLAAILSWQGRLAALQSKDFNQARTSRQVKRLY